MRNVIVLHEGRQHVDWKTMTREIVSEGFMRSRAAPTLFFHPTRVAVRGDDITFA